MKRTIIGVVVMLFFISMAFTTYKPVHLSTTGKTTNQVGRVVSKIYPLSNHEHMIIIDIPDKYAPRRCAIFTDDNAHTSVMNCNFDGAGDQFPLEQDSP